MRLLLFRLCVCPAAEACGCPNSALRWEESSVGMCAMWKQDLGLGGKRKKTAGCRSTRLGKVVDGIACLACIRGVSLWNDGMRVNVHTNYQYE